VEGTEEFIVGLLDPLTALKRLPRTGWLLAGIAQPESVADHAYATATLALLLAGMVNRDVQAEGLTESLDGGRVTAIALVHDLGESMITDLPRRAAVLLGAEAKHAAEARAFAELFGSADPGSHYVSLWQEYDRAATPEARLVRDADKLEMVHQALVYERAGQSNLDEFWEGHHWYYLISERVYARLARRRQGWRQATA
jgi:putative hydrolase of HD superfamily